MHFKKSINHGSFYIQGLRSFKDTVPKNVKKILNKKGYIYSDIISNRIYLVGSKISKVSYPKSGANTAWVPSPTAAALHSLHYHLIKVKQIQNKLENMFFTDFFIRKT